MGPVDRVDEPRVRSSAYVLILALAALALTWWVGDALFTALLNTVTAGVVWYLVKGAGVVRHPLDPLGPSTDGVFRGVRAGPAGDSAVPDRAVGMGVS